MNTEFCAVAVSQRVVTVPEGADFACTKCGEPLQEADAARAAGRSRVLLGLQVGVLLLGGAAIAYKLGGGFDAPPGASPGADTAALTPPAAPQATAQLRAPAPLAQAQVAPPAPVMPLMQAALPPPPTAVAQPAPVAPPAPFAQPAAVAQQAAVAVPSPAAVPATSAAAPAAAVPAKPAATELLRLVGSDVIGNRLARRLASGYLGLIGDNSITLTPTKVPGTVEVAGIQTGEREMITIVSSSSTAGLNALMRGNADLAMSSRRLTPAEAERYAGLGDLTKPASEHLIGLQGLAAIVNPASQVASLTVAQVRAILSGQVLDWSEVGGSPGRVNVYVVAARSDAAEEPHDFVLGQDTLSSTARPVANEQALSAAVAGDRSGIGIVTAGAEGIAKTLAVSDNGSAAVEPTDIAISTESYPLTRRLYLYTAAKPSNLFVRRFIDFVSSPTGQAAVEAAGYVALTVKAETAAVPDAASERFRQIVGGAARVSFDLRFQPGSMELDGRGLRDLERFVNYVRTQRISPGRIILAGFADNSGAPAVNLAVSQRRAEVVNSFLSRAGITAGKVVPFGSDLPVADNSTMDGRERNRRVEVYLAP